MSRLILGLCSFVLTVVLIAFAGEDVGATDSPGVVRPATTGPVCTRPRPPRQIIRVAKKKPRAKKGMKKEDPKKDDMEPAETTTTAEPKKEEGGVKFSRDVAPIFVANCVGCHSVAGKTKGQFDLSSFEKLMKGSTKEKVIEPGDPEKSELLLRVKGESASGKKMPPGAMKNLGENAIAKIEAWIKAGAILDKGIDPKAMLDTFAVKPDDLHRAELAKMKPEERDKLIEDQGTTRWKKATQKIKPEVKVGKNFILFSTLPKNRADATVKVMDAQHAKLKSLLGPAVGDALNWVEKVSLYVFKDRTTFVEFVRGVENREVEEDDRACVNFGVFEPYIALVDPLGGQEEAPAPTKKAARGKKDDETPIANRTLTGVAAEQLTIGVLSKAGKAPRWVALGLGALMEAQLERGSPYIMKLRSDAYQMADQGWLTKASEALGDQAKVEEVRAAGYAIMEWVNSTQGALGPFVRGMLKGGEKLDEVLGDVFGGNREQFLDVTNQYVIANYGGRRR